MSAPTLKGRLIIKIASERAYTSRFETSPDGTTWTSVLEGKTTRK